MRFSIVIGVLVVLLMFTLPMCAQLDTGTITGRVTDPSGGVVAGAQVVVIQVATNFENVTQTNSEGLWRVQSLRPGIYRVTVSVSGFKKLVRENVELRTNATLEVNLALELGSVSESVEVTDAVPLLQTENAVADQVLEGKVFYSLPIFQRQLRTALYYLPGMTQGNTAWPGQLGAFHINGLQGTQIGFFEDGVLASNMYDGNAVNTAMAGVEQVNVLTSTLPAEYGHSPGGALTIVKKTGTNLLHFSAQEMILTRSMFPRGFFEKESLSTPKVGYPNGQPYLYQTPDGVITGPVWIPKIYNGKDKTFFMFAVQIPFSQESKYGQYTVPTTGMLGGDFTYGGIGQQIYDPVSTRKDASGNWFRDAFPGNIVPLNRFSNVAKTIISHNPWRPANAAGSTTTTGTSGNIIACQPLKLWWPSYTFRVDHQFTQKFKAYATLTWNNFYTKNGNAAIGYAPYDSNQALTPQIQYTPSVGLSWVVSPTLISETRLGMYRLTSNGTGSYQQAMANTLVNEAHVPGIPSDWYVGTISPGVGNALGNPTNSVLIRQNRSFKQDITQVRGTHAIKFGYDYLAQSENSHNIASPRLSFGYASTAGIRTNGTAAPGTGNSFAAFLVGALSSISVSRQGPSWLPQTSVHSFYVQDDWKIIPKLTLNLGLRYSTESPLTTKNDAISVWDPAKVDDIAGTYAYCPTTGCVGMWTHPKGAWYNRDTNNFQPRVGLAWHPLNKLVFRGGFSLTTQDMGLSWYTSRDEFDLSFSQTAPLNDYRPISNIDQGPPTIVWPTLRADGTVPYAGTTISSRSGIIIPKSIHNPYTMNWNTSIQYQLATNYMIDLSYSGSAGVGVIGNSQWNSRPWGIIPNPSGSGTMDLNDPANATYRNTWIGNTALQAAARPWTNWGTVNYRSNFGHSVYHSGTAKVEKRYSQGLTVISFYTYSKCIEVSPGNPNLNWGLNRQRCGYDETHRYVGTMNYELPMGKGKKFFNHGGIVNRLLGDYSFSWNYQIWSSNPSGMGISNSPASGLNYPSWMPTYGGVILNRRPKLRDNWQDLGGDRFTQINQNSMIDCGAFQAGYGNDCFTWVPAYSRGNNGGNVWTKQRIIAANLSVRKDIAITEKLKAQIRFDYQNPLKWYNWTGLSTTLDLNNPKLYGTPGTGEQDISLNGGHPLMWLFVSLKW